MAVTLPEGFDPMGLRFYDKASGRFMCLVSEKPWVGWLFCAQEWPGGNWVPLRLATEEDKKTFDL